MSDTSSQQTKTDGGEMTLSIPSWILMAMVALVPPVFANGYSNFEAFKQLVFVGGTGLALLSWGVLSIRQRAISMVAGRVTMLALLFGGYVLAASLWSDNILLGLWEALPLACLAAVVLIVTAPVGRPLRFYELAVSIGVGAALAGLMGLLDLAGLGVFTVVWDPPGPTGAFDAMEFATAYYVVALPTLLGATFRYGGKTRYFFAGCFLIAACHFGLVAGWTMAAIFAVVCAVVTGVIVAFQRTPAVMVLVPVFVLLGVLGVFMAIGQWGFEQPAPVSDATSLPHLESPALEQREYQAKNELRNILFSPERVESIRTPRAHSYLLQVTSSLFVEQPVVGHGAGAWWPLQTKHVHIDHPYVAGWFDWYPAFRSPHNGASKLLVEYGLVGVVLFALWLAAVLGVAFSSLAGPGEREEWILEHWALLTSALAGLVFLFFTPLLELSPALLTWGVGLAILMRLSAALNGFRGWSNRWAAGATEEASMFKAVSASAGLAVVIGAAMLVPTGLNFASGLYRGQADHLMLRTHYREAIDAYERADRWYPAYGDVPLNIGLAGSRIGSLGEVEEEVVRAVEMRPYDVRALTLRGRIELTETDRSRAVEYGERAVDAFPNGLDARRLLVAAHDMQGDYEEAVEEAIELIERDPPRAHRARLHMLVGDLYFDMLERFSDAKQHYQKAHDLIETPQQRAKLKEKVQRLEEMIEDQQRIREGKQPIHQDGDGHGH